MIVFVNARFILLSCLIIFQTKADRSWGLSGGAIVLSKLPVPGRPTNLYDSRARAYCACSRCGWGLGDGLKKTEILTCIVVLRPR